MSNNSLAALTDLRNRLAAAIDEIEAIRDPDLRKRVSIIRLRKQFQETETAIREEHVWLSGKTDSAMTRVPFADLLEDRFVIMDCLAGMLEGERQGDITVGSGINSCNAHLDAIEAELESRRESEWRSHELRHLGAGS